jgi:hypothetical protein
MLNGWTILMSCASVAFCSACGHTLSEAYYDMARYADATVNVVTNRGDALIYVADGPGREMLLVGRGSASLQVPFAIEGRREDGYYWHYFIGMAAEAVLGLGAGLAALDSGGAVVGPKPLFLGVSLLSCLGLAADLWLTRPWERTEPHDITVVAHVPGTQGDVERVIRVDREALDPLRLLLPVGPGGPGRGG